MTVNTKSDDWNELAAAWQATATPPPLEPLVLRRRVARMRRRAMVAMTGEVLLTAVFAGCAVYAVRRVGDARSWIFAYDVAAIIVAAWGFGLWNRRGTWRLASETTEAYLALLRLRCRRRMQAAWFVWAVVLAQVAAVTLANRVAPPSRPSPLVSMAQAVGLPAITVLVFVAAGARMYLRARRELRNLDDALIWVDTP
jgi:hypothetical protein